jgi:hypothetical protein
MRRFRSRDDRRQNTPGGDLTEILRQATKLRRLGPWRAARRDGLWLPRRLGPVLDGHEAAGPQTEW